MQEIKSIGVIGHTGMVGNAVFQYFKNNFRGLYSLYGYSRSQPQDKDRVNQSDLVFVCVPTPFDWNRNRFDLSHVESVLEDIVEERIVVLKSTVPIGTTEKLQEKYPKLNILFNPEFLSEATAQADFNNPDRQYVGFTKKSFSYAVSVLNILPESAYGILVPSKEAELLKYINNLHGALSVIEANHFYDVCQKENLDYGRVMKAAEASKWVGAPMGRQYHNIYHKGFRGFGGKCFPKDISAWLEWCKEKEIKSALFDAVKKINIELLAVQNMSMEEAEKR